MTSWTVDTTAEDVIAKLGGYVTGKTGPSHGGLGAAVALHLASAHPASLVLAGRNESKIAPVIEQIQAVDSNIKVSHVQLDLLDNASVRDTAAKIKTLAPQIDILINNAGLMAAKDFVKSKDGVESQLAANHIGHFLLTKLLLPSIKSGGRIVNVSSQGYQLGPVRFDDYNFEDGKSYNRWIAYGQAKTAGVLFTSALGKLLKNHSVSVYGPHPGVVLETQLAANADVDEAGWGEAYMIATKNNGGVPPPPDIKSLSQGAACVLIPALDPALAAHSGAFLVDNQHSQPREHARGQENEDALWKLSEQLINEPFKF